MKQNTEKDARMDSQRDPITSRTAAVHETKDATAPLHSPLPWYVGPDETQLTMVFDAAGIGVANVFSGRRTAEEARAKANLSLIVHRVNTYDDLLAALKGTLDWLASYPGGNATAAYERTRAAIAKAEGR